MATVPLGEIADLVRVITFKPGDVVEPGTEGSTICMRTKNVQFQLEVEDLLAVPDELVRRTEQYLQPAQDLARLFATIEAITKAAVEGTAESQ